MFILFKIVLWSIVALIGAGILKELYSYLIWFKYYKSQGIRYEYTPIVGFIYYFLVDLHPVFEDMNVLRKFMNPLFSKGDSLAKFRWLYHKTRADIVAVNHQFAEPLLIFFNPELITELTS